MTEISRWTRLMSEDGGDLDVSKGTTVCCKRVEVFDALIVECGRLKGN